MSTKEPIPRVERQQVFFPRHPREVCAEIGLQWLAAQKLAADGYLSFDPASVAEMDEGLDVELVFVGTLAVWSDDQALLDRLLHGLQKPYRYRMDRMRYDWTASTWKALPEPQQIPDPSESLDDWLETLVEEDDIEQLNEIRDRVSEAIRASSASRRRES